MSRSHWSSRFALWAAVCALLLKAAVPMLASASAQAQGKTLVEVCTVYGVATVALDEQGAASAPEHTAAHAGEHCALNALVALAVGESAVVAVPAVTALHVTPQPRLAAAPPDATTAWAARLRHGPPAFA